jgi:hypothetical protein
MLCEQRVSSRWSLTIDMHSFILAGRDKRSVLVIVALTRSVWWTFVAVECRRNGPIPPPRCGRKRTNKLHNPKFLVLSESSANACHVRRVSVSRKRRNDRACYRMFPRNYALMRRRPLPSWRHAERMIFSAAVAR